VAASTVVWLGATLLTKPEKMEVLEAFYRRVRPGASLWGPVAAAASDVPRSGGLAFNLLDWFSGCVMVYMTLFGVGKLIFGETLPGFGSLAIALVAGAVIYRDLNRRGWESVVR
jgi:hypothetical protein